jgi:bifunctional non-homologous end joining protein LigD
MRNRKIPPAPEGLCLGKDCLVIVGEKDGPPEGKEWFHEIKVDGWRVAVLTDGHGGLRVQTKSGTCRTWDFVSPVKHLAFCGRAMIIDGEIAVPDKHGVTRIDRLHAAMREGRTEDLVFFGFDLLHLDGLDLRTTPIEKRKDAMVAALNDLKRRHSDELARVIVTDRIECEGTWLFNMASQVGAEGIVSKRRGTPYLAGPKPSRDWIKTICNPA